MMNGECGKMCGCPHHKAPGMLVFLIGLAFLLKAFDVLTAQAVDIIWPILLMVGAAMKLGSSKCKCC